MKKVQRDHLLLYNISKIITGANCHEINDQIQLYLCWIQIVNDTIDNPNMHDKYDERIKKFEEIERDLRIMYITLLIKTPVPKASLD